MDAVVDTNVFLHGTGRYGFEKVYTVQEAVEELESSEGRNRLETMDYEVRSPSKQSMEKVKQKADEINAETSEVDQKLLALALDLQATLVTDDKGLQNLALHIGADFQGFLGDEVDEKFRWKIICKNCGSEVEGEKCSCGSTRLRRKLVRNS